MRVLVLSDIHGNADALRAVLEHARGWDEVWVLGDLVDYGPEPHVVVDTVRELEPRVIVRGNHDNAVAFGVDCFCDPRIHELSVYTRENISLKLLSRDQVEWLRSLPIKQRIQISDHVFYIVHGSPLSPLYGYLRPDMPEEKILEHLSVPSMRLGKRGRLVSADVVVVGHTHIPFRLCVKDLVVVNPGSVGQPRDGVPAASYMILDTETLETRHYRVKYDIGKVLKKLESLGLEERYYEWLKRILLSGKA